MLQQAFDLPLPTWGFYLVTSYNRLAITSNTYPFGSPTLTHHKCVSQCVVQPEVVWHRFPRVGRCTQNMRLQNMLGSGRMFHPLKPHPHTPLTLHLLAHIPSHQCRFIFHVTRNNDGRISSSDGDRDCQIV